MDAVVMVSAAYLIGSIPVPYLVARLVADVDVRAAGEGNVGARNVFHVVGASWGIVAFVADFGKGALVAALFGGETVWKLALAGGAVLLGHAFPVWLGFVGGKGLSTIGGFTVVLMPWAAVIGTAAAAATWAMSKRFLPTTVVAIVVSIIAGPATGVSWSVVATVVGLFALTGVKRALDERRMRVVEARTGWDRVRGLGS